MLDRKEAVIALAAQISESRLKISELDSLLGSERVRLSQLEDDLEKLLGSGRAARDLSLNNQICQQFEEHPTTVFSSEQLSATLNAKVHSVRSALVRLCADGKINRKGRGRYISADGDAAASNGVDKDQPFMGMKDNIPY